MEKSLFTNTSTFSFHLFLKTCSCPQIKFSNIMYYVSNRSTCWRREEDGCYRPSVPDKAPAAVPYARSALRPPPSVFPSSPLHHSSRLLLILITAVQTKMRRTRMHVSRKQLLEFFHIVCVLYAFLKPLWTAKNINEGWTSLRFIWIRKMHWTSVYEMHNSDQIIPPVLSKGFDPTSPSRFRGICHTPLNQKASYCWPIPWIHFVFSLDLE